MHGEKLKIGGNEENCVLNSCKGQQMAKPVQFNRKDQAGIPTLIHMKTFAIIC